MKMHKHSAKLLTRQLSWRVNWNRAGLTPITRLLRYGFEGYGRKGMQSKPFPVSNAPAFTQRKIEKASKNDQIDMLAQLRVVPVIKLSPSRKGNKRGNPAK